MSQTAAPEYGASDRYLGDKGKEYFAWQNSGALFGGRINAHKFQHLVRPESTVLDFGCGGGALLHNLTCARKIGVEINPHAREEAKRLGHEMYADLAEVPDAVADLIVSDHALEHVPFPIGALKQMAAKLKPGGVLSICVPYDTLRRHRVYVPDEPNHHLHTWTPQLLGNTLSEAGYAVESVYGRVHAWPGNWTVAAYGRLPYALFKVVCHVWGVVSGKGHEVLAVARPKGG